MKHAIRCAALSLIATILSAQAAEAKKVQEEPRRKIEIFDQKVALVNTEAISKRDVEERMGEIALRLQYFKKEKTANGQWNAEADAEWTRMYVEDFRKALRIIVRERLMLQHFVIEKLTIDEKHLQKRTADYMEELRRKGVRDYSYGVETKRVKEVMMLQEFRGKFDNALEYPKKPEVEKYYQDHLEKYVRKAGVKIRVIRIDRSYMDKLTGTKKVRDNAYEMVQEIRRDIVDLGALFSEVAKNKNDDQELKERGGLVIQSNKDPYIIVEEYNKILANATRNLEPGKVSEVFEYGNGYAIALLEDRREAGPAPLEGKLYEVIYNEMYENKRVKKEDEWFRATLAKTLVMQIVEGNARPLPIDFFFPDDKKNPDFVSDADKKDDKKKDEKKDAKK